MGTLGCCLYCSWVYAAAAGCWLLLLLAEHDEQAYMVAPLDQILAQVTAHKACSTSDKHTIALNTWLGLDHCAPGKARCLQSTDAAETAY